LTKRALTFREIFEEDIAFLASKNVLFELLETVRPGSFLLEESLWRASNN
jgi:hypothetical protein